MTRRLTIAIADDDRDTREYLQEYLSRLGHDVSAAADGPQLVELCRQVTPDLVVSDYSMPGMDGLAAVAEINRERAVPVVLISAREEVEPAALAVGPVVRFLAKPVKEADLRAAVEAAAQGALSPSSYGAPGERR